MSVKDILIDGKITEEYFESANFPNIDITQVDGLQADLTGLQNEIDTINNSIGQPNGIVPLNALGQVDPSYFDPSVVQYLGTWSPATNTPTLVAGVGDLGDMYLCSDDGTQFGIDFLSGDFITYADGIWTKISSSLTIKTLLGGQNINISDVAGSYTVDFVPFKNAETYYVSPNGSNTANGSFETPYQTITYALTQISTGCALVLMNGTYTENLTIDISNIDIIALSGNNGSAVTIVGTTNFQHVTGSVRVRNISFSGTINHSLGGLLYFNRCNLNSGAIFTDTATEYLSLFGCDWGSATSINFNGAHIYNTFGSNLTNVIVNNMNANVNLQNSIAIIGLTLTNGTVLCRSGVIYSPSEITNAITTLAGTVLCLVSVNLLKPTSQTDATVNIGGIYNFHNVTYDKPNSTLATNLNQSAHFNRLTIDGILATLSSSATALVKDPTTGDIKEAPLVAALNSLTDVNVTGLVPTNTIGWNGTNWIPQTVTSEMNITETFLLHCNLDSIAGGILDDSIYGLTGTNIGTTLTTGKIANAIEFTANGQYVDFGPQTHVDFTMSDEFSTGLWMNTVSSNLTTRVLVSQGNGTNNNGWALLYQSNINEFTIKFMESSTLHNLEVAWRMDANELINDGNWHNIIVSKKTGLTGATCSLFLDGVDMVAYKNIKNENILAGESIQTLGTANLMIGDSSAGWSTLNQHKIDEVFISNFAMIESTAESIFTLANGIYTNILTVVDHTHSQTAIRGLVDRLNADELAIASALTDVTNADSYLTITAPTTTTRNIDIEVNHLRRTGSLKPLDYFFQATIVNGGQIGANSGTVASVSVLSVGELPVNRGLSDYNYVPDLLAKLKANFPFKIRILNISDGLYATFSVNSYGGAGANYQILNVSVIAGETNATNMPSNGQRIFVSMEPIIPDVTNKIDTITSANNFLTITGTTNSRALTVRPNINLVGAVVVDSSGNLLLDGVIQTGYPYDNTGSICTVNDDIIIQGSLTLNANSTLIVEGNLIVIGSVTINALSTVTTRGYCHFRGISGASGFHIDSCNIGSFDEISIRNYSVCQIGSSIQNSYIAGRSIVFDSNTARIHFIEAQQSYFLTADTILFTNNNNTNSSTTATIFLNKVNIETAVLKFIDNVNINTNPLTTTICIHFFSGSIISSNCIDFIRNQTNSSYCIWLANIALEADKITFQENAQLDTVTGDHCILVQTPVIANRIEFLNNYTYLNAGFFAVRIGAGVQVKTEQLQIKVENTTNNYENIENNGFLTSQYSTSRLPQYLISNTGSTLSNIFKDSYLGVVPYGQDNYYNVIGSDTTLTTQSVFYALNPVTQTFTTNNALTTQFQATGGGTGEMQYIGLDTEDIKVSYDISFLTSNVANNNFRFVIFKNGVIMEETTRFKSSVAGEFKNVNCEQVLSLAPNDTLSIRAENQTASGALLRMNAFNFKLEKMKIM